MPIRIRDPLRGPFRSLKVAVESWICHSAHARTAKHVAAPPPWPLGERSTDLLQKEDLASKGVTPLVKFASNVNGVIGEIADRM